MKVDNDGVKALRTLSTTSKVTGELLSTLAKFTCAAYSPKGIHIKTITELR